MKLTERQRSVLIALGFAVAAAVIIILAVKKSGSSGPSTPKASGGDVVVFVAARDIPANTPGSELAGSVETQRVARSSVVAGAISQLAQVEGRTSTSTIYKGEQINLQRFQPVQAEGVTGQITGTNRAYQLPGDPNQLLVGTLKTGDHVDVIANVKFKLLNFREGSGASSSSAQQTVNQLD
jgi:Flp pilus assembly protein CpaB